MFKENFIKLCNKRSEAPSVVCQKIGLSSAAFSKWQDDSVPRRATLQKFADYFGVTVDDLLSDRTQKIELKEKPLELQSNGTMLDQQNIFMIPLYENVSAGFGALAVDSIVDYIPHYFSSAYEAQETIFIKVRGDSMFPKIEDGDIIQVHKQDSVDSGQVAVVLLDNEEALVKKVVYGSTWIELHSFNPMYKTMRFNDENVLRIRVVGLVKAVTKTM